MLLATLSSLFDRELNKIKQEIGLYRDEQKIWVIDKNIANSAGNLALHLVGNLNHFIGKELGGTGYVRNRDLEFSQKDVPQAELLTKIEDTHHVVIQTLSKLGEDDLAKEYPLEVFEKKTTTEFFLIHLLAHLSYHLGQINYHRRLLDTAQ
jgi:uncharacterized damage-inducible protein DinB